jgi:hypothetical protein
MIRAGDRVRIQGKEIFCTARVVVLSHIDELPAIPGAPDAPEVRAVLSEAGVDLVAVLMHHNGQRELIFTALRTTDGQWFDLQAQPLRISKVWRRRRQ